MEFKYSKHVKIVIDLEVGDTVRTDGWGPNLDGRDLTIEKIDRSQNSESGFMVKLKGCDFLIDSNWLNKVQ